MDLTILLLVLAVIFISTLIRSTFGFGNALIAIPLLVLMIGVKSASPLIALIGMLISVLMLIQGWQAILWKEMIFLLLASLPGIPLGLILLTAVPETIVNYILGFVLIGFGLYNLAEIQLPSRPQPWLAVPFGLLAGVLGGAYNANGPPVLFYAVFRGWNKDQLRASLQGFFFVSNILILAGHGISGLWTREILLLFVASVPLVVLAVYLGRKITDRISQEIFNKSIYYFLVLTGILMFL